MAETILSLARNVRGLCIHICYPSSLVITQLCKFEDKISHSLLYSHCGPQCLRTWQEHAITDNWRNVKINGLRDEQKVVFLDFQIFLKSGAALKMYTKSQYTGEMKVDGLERSRTMVWAQLSSHSLHLPPTWLKEKVASETSS